MLGLISIGIVLSLLGHRWVFGDLWMWLQLMWVHVDDIRSPAGVVCGRCGPGLGPEGSQAGPESNTNDPDRTSDSVKLQPHDSNAITKGSKHLTELALELVYRAEIWCKSRWAPAGAFPRAPRDRAEQGIGPKKTIYPPPLPQQKKNIKQY